MSRTFKGRFHSGSINVAHLSLLMLVNTRMFKRLLQFYIMDTNSSNGTYVNDVRVGGGDNHRQQDFCPVITLKKLFNVQLILAVALFSIL